MVIAGAPHDQHVSITALRSFLLIGCLLITGCVRAGFSQRRPLDSGDGPAKGDDASDGRRDLPSDVGSDLGFDGAPDLVVPPTLSCKVPAIAGTSQPVGLRETALRVDALQLVAHVDAVRYSTKRDTTDQPFGAWVSTTAYPFGADITFFVYKGVERAIVASDGPYPRHLELCTFPNSCTKFPVRYASSGTEVTADMDGPSVAITANGLLMAHNIDPSGAKFGDIYLATPINAADLTKGWTTTVVPALAQPGSKEDDPALSPDGLLLLFVGLSTNSDWDIWISARATLADTFPAPTQLGGVNSAMDDTGPYLAEVTIKGQTVMELYFMSDRDGIHKAYRAECSY